MHTGTSIFFAETCFNTDNNILEVTNLFSILELHALLILAQVYNLKSYDIEKELYFKQYITIKINQLF